VVKQVAGTRAIQSHFGRAGAGTDGADRTRAGRRNAKIPRTMDHSVDPARLRTGRLARLQAAMRVQHVEACLLFNEPNVRYATGASAMPIWSNTTFVRCALVPAEGRAILFEHPNSMHLFRGFEADVRPMHAWEFYDDTETHAKAFASETVAALREMGVTGPRLAGTLLRRGGEHLATSTVCSGPNTNPWRARTTARPLEPGDLVYVDTDAVGVEGYFFCVSRTFLCGGRPPTPAQREIYRAAHDWLLALKEMVRPGLTCRDLADRAPRLPAKYMPQHYEVMIHGIGLEEESPSVAYPGDPQPNGDRALVENMALVVELYCGEVGGRDGVKLGDQVVVTSGGVKDLVPYRYSAALLH